MDRYGYIYIDVCVFAHQKVRSCHRAREGTQRGLGRVALLLVYI